MTAKLYESTLHPVFVWAVRHGVPGVVGLGTLMAWCFFLVFHPIGVTDILWGDQQAPRSARCGPWETEAATGLRSRWCSLPLRFHDFEFRQVDEVQPDGVRRLVIKGGRNTLKTAEVTFATAGGFVLWAMLWWLWLRVVGWPIERKTLNGKDAHKQEHVRTK